MSNLTNNTTKLNNLLEKVNALPEATSENLDAVLTEQEAKIAELSALLDTKAAGGGSVEIGTFTVDLVYYSGGNTNYLYVFPFIIGMTWREWMETPLNIRIPLSGAGPQRFSEDNGYPKITTTGLTSIVSLDGISGVSSDEKIQDGCAYTLCIDPNYSDGY